MDTLTQKIRARFDHNQQRRILKEKYEAKLTFAWADGLWRATPEMITFLSLYGEQRIVVLDLYETPIQVHANVLCGMMKSRWQEQMNAWQQEYTELSRQR